MMMCGHAAARAARGSNVFRPASAMLRRLTAPLAQLLSVRRSERALALLDERMLRDIGLRCVGPRYLTCPERDGGH